MEVEKLTNRKQVIEENGESALVVLVLVAFLAVLLRNAWVTEDAFITFRVADNFLHGYGLTWNIAERVQVFTHPLWLMLMIPMQWVTGEPYYTSIGLSLVISVVSAWLVIFKAAKKVRIGIVAIAVLVSSKAFVDFSVSGLENPLTHLLIILFWLIYLRKKKSAKILFGLTLVAGLAMLSRIDNILLFAPMLVWGGWRLSKRKAVLTMLAGLTPVIAWSVFSLFYYGFIWPNTAYAKLGHGVPRVEIISQSYYYFINSLTLDPVTLVVIGTGLVMPFFLRDRKLMMASLGILLYLGYVVWIGGDFMSGRFFTASFLLATLIIINSDFVFSRQTWLGLLVVLLFISVQSPRSPIWSGKDYAEKWAVKSVVQSIADERAFYYDTAGLLNAEIDAFMPRHSWALDGQRIRGEGPKVVTSINIGYFGYYAGPEIYIVDVHTTGDALRSRLPVTSESTDYYSGKNWRIGHFARDIPDGYITSLETGENLIVNPALAEYWDHLSLVIRGELWSVDRLVEIIKFNMGEYDQLIEDYNKVTRS